MATAESLPNADLLALCLSSFGLKCPTNYALVHEVLRVAHLKWEADNVITEI